MNNDDDPQRRIELADALRESLEIARRYRERIADKDSIALLQDLETVAEILGICGDTLRK